MNEPQAIQATPEPRHSGMGIASFVISVITGITTFLIFVYAGMKEMSLPGGVSEHSGVAMMIGFSMILAWMLLFVGMILGAVALFEKNRKKVFAVLGLVFNLGMLVLSALLIVIGISMSP